MSAPRMFIIGRSVLALAVALAPFADFRLTAAERTSGAPTLSLRGVVSADDENEDNDPDPRFRPNIVTFKPRTAPAASGAAPKGKSGGQKATGSAATTGSGSSGGKLKDHPNAQKYAQQLQAMLNMREVDVALLGGHKYMVNDCLGLKVSAGEFALKFINPSIKIDGTGLLFECGIDRISFSAIKLRMRPRVPSLENPNPCKFGKKFEVGGSADDIRITMRMDPVLDLERCRIYDVFTPETKVRIGNLNLKPLQNNLDAMAKNMVEDALTYFLNLNLHGQMLQALDDLLEADCPGNPGNAGKSMRNTLASLKGTGGGGSTSVDAETPGPAGGGRSTPGGAGTAGGAGNTDTNARLRDLEQRVAALERRLAAQTPATPRPGGVTPSERTSATVAPARTGLTILESGSNADAAFQLFPNPELKGRLGRIVVTFPDRGSKTEFHAYTAVHRAGNATKVDGFYQSGKLELMPDAYDVVISGRKVPNVPIEAGQDTVIHVGVLRLQGGKGTYFSVHNVGAKDKLQGNYGTADHGLPIGEYEVMVQDGRQKVVIQAGKLTEF